MNDVKKDSGVFLDGILNLLVEGLGLAKEPDESKYMEANDIENEVISWAYENLQKIVVQKPKGKKDLLCYIFKLLTIQYRCMNAEVSSVPERLMMGIRDEMIIALKLYVENASIDQMRAFAVKNKSINK